MNTEGGLKCLFKSRWYHLEICTYNQLKCFYEDYLSGWDEVQEYIDFYYNNFYLLYFTSIVLRLILISSSIWMNSKAE